MSASRPGRTSRSADNRDAAHTRFLRLLCSSTAEFRTMRLDTSQQMRTDMRLRMAPRMIQSMEILQLPLMALQERIDQELSENPVLIDLRESPGSGEADGDETSEAPVAEPEVVYEGDDWGEMYG